MVCQSTTPLFYQKDIVAMNNSLKSHLMWYTQCHKPLPRPCCLPGKDKMMQPVAQDTHQLPATWQHSLKSAFGMSLQMGATRLPNITTMWGPQRLCLFYACGFLIPSDYICNVITIPANPSYFTYKQTSLS